MKRELPLSEGPANTAALPNGIGRPAKRPNSSAVLCPMDLLNLEKRNAMLYTVYLLDLYELLCEICLASNKELYVYGLFGILEGFI